MAEDFELDTDLNTITIAHEAMLLLKKQNAALRRRAEWAERNSTIMETALRVAQKELYRMRDEVDHATQAYAGIMASLKSVGAVTLDAISDAKNRGYNGVLLQTQKPGVETFIPDRTEPVAAPPPQLAQPKIEPVVVRNLRSELAVVGIDLNRKAVGAN